MIKLSTKTLITNIVYKTIEIWKSKLPEKSLDSYENWKEDIVDGICSLLQKRNINVDEAIIIEEENQSKE